MKEKVLRFGRSAALVGVLAEPTRAASGQDRPAVILLNSGILHRVGACRLHVKLARRLATDGYSVLRFDFSGMGDSEPRKDSLRFEESAVIETREAMDHLAASRGCSRFVLVGLCSGADMAHEVARADRRVVGLGMLDAWAYRTWGFLLHHYGARIGKPAVWKNFIRIRLERLRKRHSTARGRASSLPDDVYELPRYVREFPPRSRVEQDLRDFMERRMRLLFIFSGGQPEHFNHREQYERSFRSVDFRDRVQVEYLPEADHIFTGLPHQDFVVAAIARFLDGFDVTPAVTRVNPETTPRSEPSVATA